MDAPRSPLVDQPELFLILAHSFPDDVGIAVSASSKELWSSPQVWAAVQQTSYRPSGHFLRACIRYAATDSGRLNVLLACQRSDYIAARGMSRYNLGRNAVQLAVDLRRYDFAYAMLQQAGAPVRGPSPMPVHVHSATAARHVEVAQEESILSRVMKQGQVGDEAAHAFALSLVRDLRDPVSGRPLFPPTDLSLVPTVPATAFDMTVDAHAEGEHMFGPQLVDPCGTLLASACATGSWRVVQYWLEQGMLPAWLFGQGWSIGAGVSFASLRPAIGSQPARLVFFHPGCAMHSFASSEPHHMLGDGAGAQATDEVEGKLVCVSVQEHTTEPALRTTLLHKVCLAGEPQGLLYWLQSDREALAHALQKWSSPKALQEPQGQEPEDDNVQRRAAEGVHELFRGWYSAAGAGVGAGAGVADHGIRVRALERPVRPLDRQGEIEGAGAAHVLLEAEDGLANAEERVRVAEQDWDAAREGAAQRARERAAAEAERVQHRRRAAELLAAADGGVVAGRWARRLGLLGQEVRGQGQGQGQGRAGLQDDLLAAHRAAAEEERAERAGEVQEGDRQIQAGAAVAAAAHAAAASLHRAFDALIPGIRVQGERRRRVEEPEGEDRSGAYQDSDHRFTPFAALWEGQRLLNPVPGPPHDSARPLERPRLLMACLLASHFPTELDPGAVCSTGRPETPIMLMAKAGRLDWVHTWLDDPRVTAASLDVRDWCEGRLLTILGRHALAGPPLDGGDAPASSADGTLAVPTRTSCFLSAVERGKARLSSATAVEYCTLAVCAALPQALRVWAADPEQAQCMRAVCLQQIQNPELPERTRAGFIRIKRTSLFAEACNRSSLSTASTRRDAYLDCALILGQMEDATSVTDIVAQCASTGAASFRATASALQTIHFELACLSGLDGMVQGMLDRYTPGALLKMASPACLLASVCTKYMGLVRDAPREREREILGLRRVALMLVTRSGCKATDRLVQGDTSGPVLLHILMQCGIWEVIQTWAHAGTPEQYDQLVTACDERTRLKAQTPLDSALEQLEFIKRHGRLQGTSENRWGTPSSAGSVSEPGAGHVGEAEVWSLAVFQGHLQRCVDIVEGLG